MQSVNKDAIRIAQVSDCHLPANPAGTYRGINPRHNLEKLLEKVQAASPDLLLLSGDLSDDGSRASYRALRTLFQPLRVPVLALPGNHDEPGLLEAAFPGSPLDTVSVSEHGAWRIIRLNSCRPGRPEGLIGDGAIADLEDRLAGNERRPHLIALHHQPVAVGNPWIDKYPLLNPEPLLRLIDRFSSVKAVVWGHIHQAYAADRGGTAMLGGPSSAINTVPGVEKFTPDPAGPAFRWLELNADRTVSTRIVRGGRC